MMLEYRNPKFAADGRIDCEVNHPNLGWIPFTVDPSEQEELDAAIRNAGGIAAYVPPPITDGDVDVERDLRIRDNFVFNGVAYDFDAVSKSRITGMGTLAGFAVAGGFQPGDLRWADLDNDFVWIASDNSYVPMDAQTCFQFAQSAAAHESRHIFHARALKDTTPIPPGYQNDEYWP